MRLTFGSILEQNKGIGPGFDFVRVFLALCVLGAHVPEVLFGNEWDVRSHNIVWIFHASILPMFFALSGFLVAGSAQRLSLEDFAINRGLRILPALIVEIFLSALVLGPVVTTFTLSQYASHPEFYSYFLNVTGLIHYRLPGVFHDNPFEAIVNASLWTVPLEVLCYLMMAICIIFGFVKKAKHLIVFAIVVVILSLAAEWAFSGALDGSPTRKLYGLFWHEGFGPPLLPCFLLGAAAYNLRHSIRYDRKVAIFCVALLVALGATFSSEKWGFLPFAFAASLPMTYIVCFVGLTKIPRLPFFARGDYSYGIYLYGFPLQQTIVHFFPAWKSVPLFMVASVVCASIFAAFSWHVVERPILRLRRRFTFAQKH
jgi:peptidoglycan/LPS O-acetylase OafA/YrhL